MVGGPCRRITRHAIGCAAGRLGKHVDGGHVVHRGRHLGGDEAPPDEVVQLKLAFGQVRLERSGEAPHVRRPDRLVCLLSVRDSRLVLRRLVRQVARAEGLFDDGARGPPPPPLWKKNHTTRPPPPFPPPRPSSALSSGVFGFLVVWGGGLRGGQPGRGFLPAAAGAATCAS